MYVRQLAARADARVGIDHRIRAIRARSNRPPKPEEPPVYEEQVVVTASKVEQQLVNAPATVSVVTADVIASTPATNYAELLRSVPGVNLSQTSARDFNITMRGATSTLATSHAGAARRPQPLSRLLRLRRLGPAAGQSERAEADRSDPRPGVGGVGRQRHERRRQLHLEDAARAERQQRHADVRHVRPRHRRRPAAGQRHAVRHQRARTRARSTIAGPTRSRPAATRRIRSRVRPAPFQRHRHAVSDVREQRHDAAEVRRARRLRRSRTTSWCSPAATRAPTASSTPASGRSTCDGVGVGYGTMRYTRGGAASSTSSPTC